MIDLENKNSNWHFLYAFSYIPSYMDEITNFNIFLLSKLMGPCSLFIVLATIVANTPIMEHGQ